MKKKFFLNSQKFAIHENRKIPYEDPKFFLGKLYHFFALHFHYTSDTPYRVWFDLDSCLTRWKRIFFKILTNSQFTKIAKFHMKTQIFPRQAIPKVLFDLHSHYNGDTPFRVWFDLENSLTRWKWNFFKIRKNSPFAKFAKFCMKNQIFSRQVIQKFFLLYTLITLLILHTAFGLIWTKIILLIFRTEFGLIWIAPWPDEKKNYF